MTRLEFIQSLRAELKKLPPEEIVAATEFYEEYFDDAIETLDTEGMTEEAAKKLREEKERQLIEEIGKPKAIARQIKSEYASRILEGEPPAGGGKVKTGQKISAVWWVIIGIISAPVSIPLAIAIGCLVFGLLTAVLSLIFGIVVTLVSVFVAGIGSLCIACASLPVALSTAALFTGIGLMGMAVSVAATVALFLGMKAFVRLLGRSARKMNEKRKSKKAAS